MYQRKGYESMEPKYLIGEKELKNLIYLANKMTALENSGVDNWEWYYESIQDYLKFLSDDYELDSDNTFQDLEEVADFELKHDYEKV
jgi:hypothetical protein